MNMTAAKSIVKSGPTSGGGGAASDITLTPSSPIVTGTNVQSGINQLAAKYTLTGNIVYVSEFGSDTAGTGATLKTAFKTITKAYSVIAAKGDASVLKVYTVYFNGSIIQSGTTLELRPYINLLPFSPDIDNGGIGSDNIIFEEASPEIVLSSKWEDLGDNPDQLGVVSIGGRINASLNLDFSSLNPTNSIQSIITFTKFQTGDGSQPDRVIGNPTKFPNPTINIANNSIVGAGDFHSKNIGIYFTHSQIINFVHTQDNAAFTESTFDNCIIVGSLDVVSAIGVGNMTIKTKNCDLSQTLMTLSGGGIIEYYYDAVSEPNSIIENDGFYTITNTTISSSRTAGYVTFIGDTPTIKNNVGRATVESIEAGISRITFRKGSGFKTAEDGVIEVTCFEPNFNINATIIDANTIEVTTTDPVTGIPTSKSYFFNTLGRPNI